MKLSKLLKSNGVGRESNFLRMLEKAEEENPIERTRESIKSFEVMIGRLKNGLHKTKSMNDKSLKSLEKILRLEKDCLKIQLRSERITKKNQEEWTKMLKRVFNPTNLPLEQTNK